MRPIFLRAVGLAGWDVLLVDVAVAVAARLLMSLVTVVVTV
jgi:hypothetical protein